jgi:hypothetical protein
MCTATNERFSTRTLRLSALATDLADWIAIESTAVAMAIESAC